MTQYNKSQIAEIYNLPFNDLLEKAHSTHRANFNPNEVQLSTLLSIKTGRCPEDCKYCSQSIRYKTKLEDEALIPLDKVLTAAKQAKESGATRFCMGAAWKNPTNRNLEQVSEMVREVKNMGLETCCTLGMLKPEQAEKLKQAGLDYYNHNLDTSPEYYNEIVTTRSYQDRLDTLENVANAGIKVCCGGILGLGEKREDRVSLLHQLTLQKKAPESIPINQLIAVPGTPMEGKEPLDEIEFIRTIAVARILFPKSYVRLSAGRDKMDNLMQAICFFAGANSIFLGDKLLTCTNPDEDKDKILFEKLGLTALSA